VTAQAAATLEGVRARPGSSWRFGGRLSTQATNAEHDVHRHVAQGFQVDALCGSHLQPEALLGERLFDNYSPGCALPAIVAWS
jgi:hypothetical protein